LTVLDASTEPPEDAMSFQRFDAGEFLLFLHPAIKSLPKPNVGITGRKG
jgi:hypothetical protein